MFDKRMTPTEKYLNNFGAPEGTFMTGLIRECTYCTVPYFEPLSQAFSTIIA